VTSGLLWIVVSLKLPLVALGLAVWWAIRNEPQEPPASDDEGGQRRWDSRRAPLRPFPTRPRRGPHGDATPPSPPRIRTVRARARTLGR